MFDRTKTDALSFVSDPARRGMLKQESKQMKVKGKRQAGQTRSTQEAHGGKWCGEVYRNMHTHGHTGTHAEANSIQAGSMEAEMSKAEKSKCHSIQDGRTRRAHHHQLSPGLPLLWYLLELVQSYSPATIATAPINGPLPGKQEDTKANH